MTLFGISVYPDLKPQEEIKDYMFLAAQHGFKRVFSSMFNVEGDNDEVLAVFRQLIENAHEAGLEVSLDVNPECFKRFGASPDDLSVFHHIGVDILRLDIDNGLEDDLKLLKNPYGIAIEFNASALPVSMINELVHRGVEPSSVLVCHNFYPQRYTGMKWQRFLEINEELKKIGVQVGAFVSSNVEPSHGVWQATQGLCTVEQHRGQPIDWQVREMLLTGNVDTIFIGNAYASVQEFEDIAEVMQEVTPDPERHLIIKVMQEFGAVSNERFYPQHKVRVEVSKDITELEQEILYEFFPHSDVGDSSEWLWRSRMPRFLYSKQGVPVRLDARSVIDPGTVVIVNNNYQHYAGEVQVVLLPIENDGTRNIVGHLRENEFSFFQKIPSQQTILFLEQK